MYVTFPDQASAFAMGRQIVEDGLAACFNLHGIRSVYTWKEELQDEQEWVVLFKTRASHASALRMAMEIGHPYKVPCILDWDASVNAAYGAWVDGCLMKLNSNPPADEPEAMP